MPGAARVRGVRLLATLALLCASCDNDLDTLFARTDAGSHDAGARPKDAGRRPETELDPYAAALHVYGDDEACVACIERECEDEARACAADEACTEDARCRTECDGDPHCQTWECNDRYPFEDRPTGPFEEGCIQTKCLEDCRVGSNFDCVGRFAPRMPQADEPVQLAVRLSDGPDSKPFPESGLRARVCSWTDRDCTEPVGDEVRSDARGTMMIQFPPARRSVFQLQGFRGYAELTDPNVDPPRTSPVLFVPWIAGGVPVSPPRTNNTPWLYVVAPPGTNELLASLFDQTLSPSRGLVVATVWDCRASHSWRASGLRAEILQADAETRIFYGLTPSASATDRTGYVAAINLPPGNVTMRLLYGETEVASTELPVRAGALTEVIVLPTPAQ